MKHPFDRVARAASSIITEKKKFLYCQLSPSPGLMRSCFNFGLQPVF